MNRKPLFLGIDVHARRDLYWVCLADDGTTIMDENSGDEKCLQEFIDETGSSNIVVGIDAPRFKLGERRKWYWKRGKWRPRKSQKGFGRHCEVVIKSIKLANPQWTPPPGKIIPEWMKRGMKLYGILKRTSTKLYEVFPSASRTQYEQQADRTYRRLVNQFAISHFRDAAIAALTVRDLHHGLGMEIGGGDKNGTIVIPRQIPEAHRYSRVLKWPVRK